MAEPRLKTALWVSAALRTGDRTGHPGMVLRKGDAESGGVLVVLRGRAGLAALAQANDGEGAARWHRVTGPEPLAQPALDACLDRQLRYDPDLWVVEFESPELLPPFPARLLEDDAPA